MDDPVQRILATRNLTREKNERRQVIRKASRYIMQDGMMSQKGFSIPLLRCIAHDDIKRVLREIHEGECSDHSGGLTLAKKILRYGYY